MSMFSLIEKWDNILYLIYNTTVFVKFHLFDKFRYGEMLKNVKQVKNNHKGEHCFVVMNGPSIAKHDLSRITNEVTFCSNFFYRSPYAQTVNPNYYCIWDICDIYSSEYVEMAKTFKDVTFIVNKKAKGYFTNKKDCFYVYGQHMPTMFKVRDNLASVSSSFMTVGFFTILCAIYMGFEKIYVLGVDFAPSWSDHCYENSEAENKSIRNEYLSEEKNTICRNYGSYYLAHLQSFYLAEHARKKGIKIYNLNPDSHIRAFEFADYDEVTNEVTNEVTKQNITKN